MTTARRKDYASMTNESLNRLVAIRLGYSVSQAAGSCRPEQQIMWFDNRPNDTREMVKAYKTEQEAWNACGRWVTDANAALALLAQHGLMFEILGGGSGVIVYVGNRKPSTDWTNAEVDYNTTDGDIAGATARAIVCAWLAWHDTDQSIEKGE